jgi:hypothetical protein
VYPDAFAGVPSERTADGERASAATSAARSPTDACRAADASKNTSFKDCVQGDPARQHAHPADMCARTNGGDTPDVRALFFARGRAGAAFDDQSGVR